MRSVLALFLRRCGFNVMDAATLSEARQIIAKERPDLTIVDYHLPDGSAFDLLNSARERDSTDATIVLTGIGTIDLAVRAIKAGAEHFLTKPVDLESLAHSNSSTVAASARCVPRSPTTCERRSWARAARSAAWRKWRLPPSNPTFRC